MTKAKGKNRLMLLQTTTTEENAKVIIDMALESKLTACIQESKIQSHYLWRNNPKENFEVYNEKEILLCFKVFKQDFKALRQLILRFHSYEIPEIIGIKLYKVSSAYQKWCEEIGSLKLSK